jgi:hypothetical protein
MTRNHGHRESCGTRWGNTGHIRNLGRCTSMARVVGAGERMWGKTPETSAGTPEAMLARLPDAMPVGGFRPLASGVRGGQAC